MSWDIFIQYLPDNASKISDIPDGFEPVKIGNRDEIINHISNIIPECDFSDKSWGILDGNGFSIEFNMGNEPEISGFACHIHGFSNEVINIIEKILDILKLKAIDPNYDNFFNRYDAEKSFKEWQNYRDRVIDNSR